MTNAFLPLRYTWRNVLARTGATAVTAAGVAVSVMAYVVITATAAGIARVAVGTRRSAQPDRALGGRDQRRGLAPHARRGRVDPLLPGRRARRAAASRSPAPSCSANEAIPRRGGGDDESERALHQRARRDAAPRSPCTTACACAPGRWPAAAGEVMIGRLLGPALGGVGIGDTLEFDSGPHRVVGVFEARGQIFEGEVWMPTRAAARPSRRSARCRRWCCASQIRRRCRPCSRR